MFSNFLNEYQPNNKIINAFQLACFQLPVSRIQKRHFSNGSLLPHGLREVQINTMFWVLIQSINSLTPLFSVELIKSWWPLLDSVLYFSLTSSQRCSILLTSLSSARYSRLFSSFNTCKCTQLSLPQLDKCKYTASVCPTKTLLLIYWAATVNLNFEYSWRIQQEYSASITMSNFLSCFNADSSVKSLKRCRVDTLYQIKLLMEE